MVCRCVVAIAGLASKRPENGVAEVKDLSGDCFRRTGMERARDPQDGCTRSVPPFWLEQVGGSKGVFKA
jgi:hypothetical protein